MHFLKRSDMATQFYLQTSHTYFYSSAAGHLRPLVGTHFTENGGYAPLMGGAELQSRLGRGLPLYQVAS